MEYIVLDNSVLLKWFVRDEEYRKEALSLLKKFTQKEIRFLVPELILYEAVNAFNSFVKAGRISRQSANRYLKKLSDLNFTIVDFSQLMQLSLRYAHKYDISVYDASYLAIAKTQKLPFYTADEKLLNKVSKSFKKIHSLSNFGLS